MKWFLLVLLAPLQLVQAQHKPNQVYTYVQQMPELPGGGGNAAIAGAIMKQLKVTKAALYAYERRPVVYFEIAPTGQVQNIHIISSSQSAGLDAALLTAVRRLPKFKPGYQQGHPVTVSFKTPIACIKLQ